MRPSPVGLPVRIEDTRALAMTYLLFLADYHSVVPTEITDQRSLAATPSRFRLRHGHGGPRGADLTMVQ